MAVKKGKALAAWRRFFTVLLHLRCALPSLAPKRRLLLQLPFPRSRQRAKERRCYSLNWTTVSLCKGVTPAQ